MLVEIFISQFEKEQYFFTQFDSKFVFSSYYILRKEKGEEKYKVKQKWEIDSAKNNTISQPDLPHYVIIEAFIKAKEQIKILTWMEYKNNY